jgi:hypothetical protein
MSAAAPASAVKSGWKAVLSWMPVDEFFAVDLRSLAFLRIGLGIMLLQEWLNRLVDVRLHYSDEGAIPRSIVGPTGPLSIFMLSGSAWWAGALMGVGCVLAVLLLVGWRTQFMTFLSWVLLLGAHGRAPYIMQGGDQVMRMLLFWGMFLPLGSCYSLDAIRTPLREWKPRVLSVASVAYVAQMAIIYLFAAAWKSDPAWRGGGVGADANRNFAATYFALSLDCFTTPLGHWLVKFPEFLKGLTIATMVLETFGPVLLFIPFYNAQLRVFTIASFVLFHAGLGACMELGNFPWICGLAWLGLLPTWFWDKLEARLRSPKRAGLVVYYDGDNGRHRRLVEAARMFLLLPESKAVPTTKDKPARTRFAGPWLVVDHLGKEHTGYAGLLALVRASALYWPLAYLLAWAPVRAAGEKVLAWRASRPAPKEGRPAETPGAQLGGEIQFTIVGFCIVYILAWNLRTLDFSSHKTQYEKYFPAQLSPLGLTLGLDQSWGLFAPSPGRMDGWYIIPARLKNGRVVDLYRDGAELTTEKPALVSETYSNTRTRKFLMNIISDELSAPRVPYAAYLYNQWNSSHGPDEQIEYLELVYMLKRTEPDRQVDKNVPYRILHYPAYPIDSVGGVCGMLGKPALLEAIGVPSFEEIQRAMPPPSPLPAFGGACGILSKPAFLKATGDAQFDEITRAQPQP